MKITVDENLTVTVTSGNKVAWSKNIKVSEFEKDDWYKFKHDDKKYEVNVFIGPSKEFVAHLYPRDHKGDPNTLIDSMAKQSGFDVYATKKNMTS